MPKVVNERQVLNALCEEAERLGATEAKIINVSSVVIEPWVQLKCRFGCPQYGKSKTCPPFAPTCKETKKILKCYTHAILVEGQPPGRDFKEMLLRLEREATLAGYHKAFVMGAGPCPLCARCPEDSPCTLPDKARPAMEACGIDVFQTVRNNGFTVSFLEKKGAYVKYFGLLLLE
ncbi:MAG TPA: DUF2284 domain-containing protein [Candidatus Hypogeohydataceae bacterium YC41]